MMQTTLYIRLGNGSAAPVHWLTEGGASVRNGELKEVALRSGQGERLCVLLPAEPILPLLATLPPLQGQRLRSAVPYAVEEQLAEDIDSYHFALGKRQADGQLPLLALRREQMATWLARLAEVELKPSSCLDEAQLLPWQPGELSLLLEEGGALLRLSAHEGYSLPLAGLERWLELALARVPAGVTTLRIFDARGEGAEAPPLQGDLAALEQHYQVVAEPLTLLASGVGPHAIDLLQGEFSRKEQDRKSVV